MHNITLSATKPLFRKENIELSSIKPVFTCKQVAALTVKHKSVPGNLSGQYSIVLPTRPSATEIYVSQQLSGILYPNDYAGLLRVFIRENPSHTITGWIMQNAADLAISVYYWSAKESRDIAEKNIISANIALSHAHALQQTGHPLSEDSVARLLTEYGAIRTE